MNKRFIMLTAFMFAMPYTIVHASNSSDAHQTTSLQVKQRTSSSERLSELAEIIKENTDNYLLIRKTIENTAAINDYLTPTSAYRIQEYKKTAAELLNITSQQAIILSALQSSQPKSTVTNLLIFEEAKESTNK